MNDTLKRRSFSLRYATYLCMSALPVFAYAQDDDDVDGPVFELQTFEVTGIRAGLESAVENKRIAPVLQDSIMAEDIGKFPDQNIAESMQRVAGVMVQRTRGEGDRVTVRGLDPKFNKVTFNGRTLTSATGGRDFSFLLLQPDLIGGVEVIKSASASMEEGALSATINAKSIKPLDLGKRQVVLKLKNSYEENADDWDLGYTGIYSDVFNDGQTGFLFGFGKDKRTAETHQFEAFGFEPREESRVTDDLGRDLRVFDYNLDGDTDDTVHFDHAVNYGIVSTERDRTNLIASFQHKVNDNLELYTDGIYAKTEESLAYPVNSHRFTNNNTPLYDPDTGEGTLNPVFDSTIENIDGAEHAVMLNMDGVDQRNNNRGGVSEETTYSLATGFKFDNQEGFTLNGEIAISDSERLSTSVALETIGRSSVSYTIGADRGAMPTINYERGHDPLDASHFYAVGFNGSYKEPTTDDAMDLRLDAELERDWGIFKSLQFGLKYTDREFYKGNRRLAVSPEALAGLLGETYEADGREGPSFNAAAYMGRVKPSSSFLSAVPGSDAAPSTWLSASNSLLFDAAGGFGAVVAAGDVSTNDSSTLTVDETVTAAYVQGNFVGEIGGLRYSGNVGVRIPHTEQSSDGYAPDYSEIVFDQGGAVTLTPKSTYTVVDRSYTDVLPSLNTIFYLNNKTDLRFAAARVISRPDLNLIGTAASVDANVKNITSTNPYLDPFEADQLDLSIEHYFDEGSVLTVAGFYKDIKSFITTAESKESHTVKQLQGGTDVVEFSRFQPSNGDGASLKGVELGYQQSLGENFGVMANYTYVDGGDSSELSAISENNYNIIAYFENDTLGARLAYNYRDGFIIEGENYFGDGSNVGSYYTLDATLNYQINETFGLSLNAVNITDQYQTRNTDPGFARLVEDTGRRFVFSVTSKF